MMMAQRLTGFDVVKAVAILLVIIGHVWRGLHTAGMIPDQALFAQVDRAIYLFHMPVFFFLSGLFFSARRPLLDFLRNRAVLLLWPMILWGRSAKTPVIRPMIEPSLPSTPIPITSFG